MRERGGGPPGGGIVVKLFKRAAELDQSEYDEKVAAGLDRAFEARRHARRAALAAAARDPLRPAPRRPRRRRRLPALRAGLQRRARLVPRARLPALPPGRRRGAVGERHRRGAAPLRRLHGAREGVHGRPRADALLRQPRHRLARRRQGQEAPRPAAARHRGARGPQAQGPRRRHAARPALPGPRTPGDRPQRPRLGALARSSCAGSGARSRTAWAGCRRRRPATTTCAPSTTSRCSAGAAAQHSPRRPTGARR